MSTQSRLAIYSLQDETARALRLEIYATTLRILEEAEARNGWELNAITRRMMHADLLRSTAGLISLTNDIALAKAS